MVGDLRRSCMARQVSLEYIAAPAERAMGKLPRRRVCLLMHQTGENRRSAVNSKRPGSHDHGMPYRTRDFTGMALVFRRFLLQMIDNDYRPVTLLFREPESQLLFEGFEKAHAA